MVLTTIAKTKRGKGPLYPLGGKGLWRKGQEITAPERMRSTEAKGGGEGRGKKSPLLPLEKEKGEKKKKKEESLFLN